MQVTIALLKNAMIRSSSDLFLVDGFPRALDQAEIFERDILPCQMVSRSSSLHAMTFLGTLSCDELNPSLLYSYLFPSLPPRPLSLSPSLSPAFLPTICICICCQVDLHVQACSAKHSSEIGAYECHLHVAHTPKTCSSIYTHVTDHNWCLTRVQPQACHVCRYCSLTALRVPWRSG